MNNGTRRDTHGWKYFHWRGSVPIWLKGLTLPIVLRFHGWKYFHWRGSVPIWLKGLTLPIVLRFWVESDVNALCDYTNIS